MKRNLTICKATKQLLNIEKTKFKNNENISKKCFKNLKITKKIE